MKALVSALLGVALLWSSASVRADEMSERREIRETVYYALMSRDFAKLEELSERFRSEKTRSASGLWKLSMFYTGITLALSVRDSEPTKFFADREAIFKAWLAAYPTSPSAHIAQSELLAAKGWRIRGNGYSSTVKPEAWEQFEHYIRLARESLERSKPIASVDPHWYEEMLGRARDEGWERPKFEALLNEALEREPYFYQTYFMALSYLLPKWRGNVADIENFARKAMARTAERDGKSLYARIYWYAAQAQFEGGLFQQTLVSWPTMRAGFDDVVERYSDAWNLNNYAKFACLARDKEKTRELMSRIESSIVAEAWNPLILYAGCRDWSANDRDTRKDPMLPVSTQF